MEGADHLLSCGVVKGILPGSRISTVAGETPLFTQRTISFRTGNLQPAVYLGSRQGVHHNVHDMKVSAVRRRRAYFNSETYVLLEPGKAEEFVTEDELKVRLKSWLQNWPGEELPPDLARFSTIDEVVSHLVKSVCELEIDGEVGSVQWYQVRLE